MGGIIGKINNIANKVNQATTTINTNVQKVNSIVGKAENSVSNFQNSVDGFKRSLTTAEKTLSSLSGKLGKISENLSAEQAASQKGVSSGLTGESVATAYPVPDAPKLEVTTLINNTGIKQPDEVINKSKENNSVIESFTFPPDLTGSSDSSLAHSWFSLEFAEYTKGDPFENGSLKPKLILNLPMPRNIQHTHGITFSESDLGFYKQLDNSIVSAANDFQSSIKESDAAGIITAGGKTAIDMANKSYNNLKTANGNDYLATFARAGTNFGLSSDIAGLIEQGAGRIFNPHTSMFFKGVNLRTFIFEWTLVPRSELEANTIRGIIRNVRKRALPKTSGTYLTYPDLVKPRIKGKAIDKMAGYKTCHIESISINYTADGTSAFFKDGYPVAINFALGLKEIQIFTSEDVDKQAIESTDADSEDQSVGNE